MARTRTLTGCCASISLKAPTSAHSADALAAVAATLNGRPRKTLGWKTPAEALDECLAQIDRQRVATIGSIRLASPDRYDGRGRPDGSAGDRERLFHSIQDEAGVRRPTGPPADDPPSMGIDDEGDVD